MSQTIDHRVVEMKFDNKQFESGVATTMSTLQKLKSSLDFSKIGDSFGNISKAANNVDMSGLDQAISGIHSKFSALEVVAISTLANITNSVVNSAKSWLSAFTIDPIRSGFQEYETQINAIQTILANTQKEGTNIDQVNSALDELNSYADKTIYNFSEMTRNIGTFTAAGVDLKTSVSAIQGIANLAAVSGSNSQQASTAMYQLSQALATGTVKLMDWNSIVNAGMGGQLFQDALIETSRLLGTGADAAIEAEGSFRDSLQAGWLTSEVLTETLKKFTTSGAAEYISNYTGLSKEAIESELELAESTYGESEAIDKAAESLAKKSGKNKDEIAETLRFAETAENAATKVKTFTQLIDTLKEAIQSGWSQSFRIIIGDFEEAQELFTEISDSFGAVISASSEARNKLLSEVFDKRNGRELLIDSLRNSMEGLISVIKPVKEAFREVFPPITAEQVYGMLEAFHDFTETLVLSKENSENLKNAFKGLFDFAKLLGDGLISLVELIIPIGSPIGAIGDGVLKLAGFLGKLLSSFSENIRSSELLSNAFNFLKDGSSALMGGLSGLIETGVLFVEKLSKMEGVAEFIDSVNGAFERLYKKAGPFIDNFIEKAENLFHSLFDFGDLSVDETLEAVSDAFSNLSKKIDDFSFDKVGEYLDSLKDKIENFFNFKIDNDGFTTFVENFKNYGEELKEAFTWDNLLDRLERIMDVFGKFFDWVKNVASAFKDFNIGSALAAGGGLGVVYAMIKVAEALENLTNPLKSIPDLLDSVKGSLDAYQTDLKAAALIKVAGAIAILAGAIVLLSFADMDKAWQATIMLGLIGSGLVLAVGKFVDVAKKSKTINDAAFMLSRAGNNLAKAVKWKAIGGAVKKFAESVMIIAGAIVALGLMYNKDKDAFKAGSIAVGVIGGAMVAIMTTMSILGSVLKGAGMANFAKAASGVLMLSLTLGICVGALNKLFKMEFPSDWEFKIKVLAGMLAGLGVLAIALGVASRLAGKNALSSLMVLSMAALLITTVIALNKLFKMEFPPDWQEKLTILGLIFTAFGALMLVMGVASRLAGKSIKAAASILAMCVFVGVVVGALAILAAFPSERLIKGASALGIVLTTLAIALFGAGKITSKDTYKSVLAMAVAVGAITASLSVLSIISFPKLLKGVVSLGSILLILAENFKQVSKITNEKAWISVAAMVVAVIGISASLYDLSEQPWSGLLSAAASLSAVLLSLAQSFKIISNTQGLNIQNIGLFLLATTSLIPIVASLYILSTQPWGNILAGGVALSGTLLAFSAAFAIVSKSNPDLTAIGTFLAASVSVGLIAIAINELSKQPWENLLSAAASLSIVLLSMSGAMAICTLAGGAAPAAIIGIGLLDLFIANFALLLVALGEMFKSEGARALMSGGAEILVQIGQAIGDFVGSIINGVLVGISSSLPQIGTDLSNFMTNLQPFISGSKNIDAEALASVGFLAAIIVALTAAEVINGIASLFGLSLVDMAVELSNFMIALGPFIEQSKLLNEDSMKACGYLASMILAITGAELIAGIARFFGISGSLASFGQELAAFGPYIKQFSEQVKGITAESVQGAASAAEIMANLSNKLPGTGGLVQKIFGEKSLSEFGQELVSFGPKINQFASQVSGITPEAVQGAASAAEIMATVANKLPPQEGFAQKIFGERSLSQFGQELVSFGPSISKFASQVSGVTPEAVQGAASAAEIMATVANKLPDSESLWNKIFGGGQVTLSQFGEELVNFGKSMTKFSNSIVGIETANINNAITSFKSLVDLTDYVKGKSATDLVNFSKEIGEIGTDSVNNFVQAFNDGASRASEAVNSFFSSIMSTLNSVGNDIERSSIEIGNNLALGIQTGIYQNEPNVISSVTSLARDTTSQLESSLPSSTFNSIGSDVSTSMANGIEYGRGNVSNASISLANAAIDGVQSYSSYDNFYVVGENAGIGLANGIYSKINQVANAAINAAVSAVNAAKSALGEASPSKVFRSIGKYVSIGLSEGILRNVRSVSDASQNIADTAISSAKDALNQIYDIIENGDPNYNPTIVPVVDLSNVSDAANEVSSTFHGLDLSTTIGLAQSVSADFSRNRSKSEPKETYDKNVEKKLDQLIKNEDDNPKIENINNFYIQSTDPKQAAEEVGYIMQHKVERGKAAWAR